MTEETTPTVLETPAADTAADTTAAPDAASAAATASQALQGMASELRSFGQQLAAVLRAAAATPEAEQLSGQIRDGLSQLRDEIDTALDGLRTRTAERTGDAAGGVLSQARGELAGALQALGRAVVRMADSVAPGDGKPAAGEPAAAEGGDATPPA